MKSDKHRDSTIAATDGVAEIGAPLGFPIAGTNYSRVRDAIRADIIEGTLPPGTRLKITELANRYGVSGMPIREALQQLQGEGIVTILPNRGAVVRAITEDFIRDCFEVWAAIESFLAEEFTVQATPEQIEELRGLQTAYDDAAARGNLRDRLAINDRFHGIINETAGNTEAIAIIQRLTTSFNAFRFKYGHTVERVPQICEEHWELIEAFTERDPDRARDISRRHLRNAREDHMRKLKEVEIQVPKEGKEPDHPMAMERR